MRSGILGVTTKKVKKSSIGGRHRIMAGAGPTDLFDWVQTGEAAEWPPSLDRLTKVRVFLPDVPLYVPDVAKTSLPSREPLPG